VRQARVGIAVVLVLGVALAAPAERTTYLERYFEVFPTRATAEGRHDFDHQLEDLGQEQRQLWVGFNSGVAKGIERQLARPDLDPEVRLDQELVLRQARQTLYEHQVLRRPERDPLWWTGQMSSATVFLLVRKDLPVAERLEAAAARAAQMGRLSSQAIEALGGTDPTEIAPDLSRIAARQARNSALFYREGLSSAAGDDQELADRLRVAGREAADAFETLADFLEELAERASGSPRLGEHYAELFRLATGEERSVEEVLAVAEVDLEEKRREVAEYGRSIWPEIFPWSEPPTDDLELIRRLFERVEQDRCTSAAEMVQEYRRLIVMAEQFARTHEIITLPDPLTVVTDNSPSFFVGQSVGGVYPAGPYAPEADTLLFLPTPSPEATAEQKEMLFRAFNHHFNVMIAPHEIVPGHYLQLKYAARHPRKVRAIFGDGVYIEGWGTFVERLMLDEGWGGPLPRVAHLKKQLENIARTIVDIRVHTTAVSREEILAFLRDEALQDEQFAGNMWMRSITSAPQLTTYYLGYRQVWELYQDVKAARGDEFVLREFMDGMMEMGPVAVRHYRARMLPEGQ
jgi:uncharacterized protein (DUF885 family)